MTQVDDEHRIKQVAAGAGILGGLTVVVCATLVGGRYLPGVLGEWVGLIVGVLTTPFLLEASFVIIGLTVVVVLNHWRQKRAGDELVYLEQVSAGAAPAGPAPWAIYREEPLRGEIPSLLVQAEGAMAIGDHESVAECLAAMLEEELKQPETLALRLALAKATGRDQLIDALEHELRSAGKEGRP